MPFLRAGLKNNPKPEPEEPKGVLPEVEPVADTVETLPENEPAVDAVEIAPENEPVTDAAEPEPEVELIVETAESDPEPEPEPEIAPEPDASGLPSEILEAVAESPSTESEPEPESPAEPDSGQDTQPTSPTTDYSGENLKYDFTSDERYVDKVSTKTEFDKMLDELADISKDLLSWQVEKFAKQHTSKFQGDSDKAESDAKKYEAFLGGYITNAAMTLYDNGYRDIAIKQLEQAKSILEARKKLEEETEATRTRVAENDDAVDLTDILGLFGD